MGIYIKGVSIPKDRDMEIIVHPDGAARVEVKEDWGTHLIGTDVYDVDDKALEQFMDIINTHVMLESPFDTVEEYVSYMLEQIDLLVKLP